jgi:hypothetical protein
MDGKGEPAQVLSLSWDASAKYLQASLSSDKVGVIHRKSRARWSVLDPIVISDTPSVSSILICSAELASPFFVLAPSYTSTLEVINPAHFKFYLTGEKYINNVYVAVGED